MKKFAIALISLVLCLTMAFGAFAASGRAVEAQPVSEMTTAEPESTQDPLEEFVSTGIVNNQEQVDQVTDLVSNLKSTISKVLDALDTFLRSFGVVVNQILSTIFKSGDLPF